MRRSDSPSDASGPADRSAGDARLSTSRPPEPPTLRLAVVRRDDAPDRATIHPREATGMVRMETWASVDLSAVVALSAWR